MASRSGEASQWLGGMGIILLTLILMPFLGIGGIQQFSAEVSSPTPDKLHPHVKDTAKRLWLIYLVFTVAETLLLWAGEIPRSPCHSDYRQQAGIPPNGQHSILIHPHSVRDHLIHVPGRHHFTFLPCHTRQVRENMDE
jgi:trk system potassium uptake protein TrkH